MKVTVEVSDAELKEICRLTGEHRKGPAIRKLVVDALLLKRREEYVNKFLSREWGVELEGLETAQAIERRAEREDKDRWRK